MRSGLLKVSTADEEPPPRTPVLTVARPDESAESRQVVEREVVKEVRVEVPVEKIVEKIVEVPVAQKTEAPNVPEVVEAEIVEPEASAPPPPPSSGGIFFGRNVGRSNLAALEAAARRELAAAKRNHKPFKFFGG